MLCGHRGKLLRCGIGLGKGLLRVLLIRPLRLMDEKVYSVCDSTDRISDEH